MSKLSSYVYTCHCYIKKKMSLRCYHVRVIYHRFSLPHLSHAIDFMLIQIKPNLYTEAEVLSGRH